MIFDLLFLVFIGFGFYQGFKNGVIYSVFSLLGWFLGIIAALRFSYMVINLLHGYLHLSPKELAIIAFVVIVLLVVVLMKLLAWALENILKSFALNLPNKIAGGLIHALVGLYLLCVFTWFLNRLDVIPVKQKETSHVYPYIGNLAPKVVEVSGKVIPYFRDTFERFDDLFGKSG
ncbi:MAG: Colicin production protein [Bacteroidota bacterium]|nr:Colicin production protein [Bacteroidota bacterium]